MCIHFDRHHSGGSSFVYVNDFWLLQKIVCIPTGISSALKKKKKKGGKESQIIVSRPGLGSDSPFGSDQEPGVTCSLKSKLLSLSVGSFGLGEEEDATISFLVVDMLR